jgi:DNA uptake protein ComE-like DNA-binding protein
MTAINLRPYISNRTAPHGSTLIVAMWVLTALAGLVLILSSRVRVETIASGNRLAQAQAEAAEKGAEQYLIATVASEITTPGTIDDLDMERRSIGDAFFWVMKPAGDDPQKPEFGLCDEAARIDINRAGSAMLQKLPGITSDLADNIVSWRSSSGGGQGAQSDYYLGLPDPYRAKNAAFESVDELLLVKDITRDVLFGYDRNRNGTLDAREMQSQGMASQINGSGDTGRGIYPFVTAWGVQASTPKATGTAAVDVNSTQSAARLRSLLTRTIGSSRVDQVMRLTTSGRPFTNVFDWYFRAQLQKADFAKVMNSVTANPIGTTTPPVTAKINVNRAPREVLVSLPGLEDSDATSIISRRLTTASSNPTDITWLIDTLSRDKLIKIGGLVTGTSRVFSGDIVAVSGDGRAFRRYHVVIDGRKTPPAIIYRRDLTDAGWPLDPQIRTDLRSGNVNEGFAPSVRGVL